MFKEKEQSGAMYCVKCGHEVPEDALHCPGCGNNGAAAGSVAENVSRLIYVLLAWLLGFLGIHNFYAGFWRRGLIQLLASLCVIGLPVVAIWVFFEVLFQTTDAWGRPMRHSCFVTVILIIYFVWQLLAVLAGTVLWLGSLETATLTM